MKIFTIGFTRKSAATFFGLLRQPGLVRLMDVRLNNVSQLAGFTKKDDLKFFVENLNGLAYAHLPLLAPSAEILQTYKKSGGNWAIYEQQFLALMAQRQVESTISPDLLKGACLLCSEASPAQCHRRLVAEYLQAHWPALEIEHLV
ncbi:MAG: DUF488 family protein [Rhodoferax sp.]